MAARYSRWRKKNESVVALQPHPYAHLYGQDFVIKALHKRQTTGYLVIYLILSLLFTVSVKLHIHTGEASHHAAHGSAVAMTAMDNLTAAQDQLQAEIEVNLDTFLNKIEHHVSVALISFTSPVVLTIRYLYCIATFRDISTTIFSLPFAGTPPLRAPPL